MAKSKTHTVKVGETLRVVLVAILFLLLFVWSWRFEPVANAMEKVTGTPSSWFTDMSFSWYEPILTAVAVGLFAWVFGVTLGWALLIGVVVVFALSRLVSSSNTFND